MFVLSNIHINIVPIDKQGFQVFHYKGKIMITRSYLQNYDLYRKFQRGGEGTCWFTPANVNWKIMPNVHSITKWSIVTSTGDLLYCPIPICLIMKIEPDRSIYYIIVNKIMLFTVLYDS